MFMDAKTRQFHHIRGLTNSVVNRKRMHQLFRYDTVSLFLILHKLFFLFRIYSSDMFLVH